MKKTSKKRTGIFDFAIKKYPKYIIEPLYRRKKAKKATVMSALLDMPSEAYIILNLGLPCIIACLAIFAFQFFQAYQVDPWGAIYEYYSFLEIISASFALNVCAPLFMDILSKRMART